MSRPERRGAVLFVAIGLLLVLAVLGARAALKLTRAAVVGGAYLGDPLVRAAVDRAAPELLPASGALYESAAETAPLDFRYPYRQAVSLWVRESGGVPDREEIILANELFREAVRRAPSYAPARYFYAVTSLNLGDADEADRNALAALKLAPLHQDIRQKVAVYFERRFRETRSDTHLASAFKAMGSERSELVRSVLSDPMMTFERVEGALDAASIPGEERLLLLMDMARWDWAVGTARELDRSGGLEGRNEGMVRIRYAAWLLGKGAKSSGLRQAEAALVLHGDRFQGHGVLAEARLRGGNLDAGLDALAAALSEDLAVESAETLLGEAGCTAARTCAFWRSVSTRDGGKVETRLALSRALIEAGEFPEARRVLKELVDHNLAYAEGNYLLARTFMASGSFEMALGYARLAAAADSSESRYSLLVETIEEEIR